MPIVSKNSHDKVNLKHDLWLIGLGKKAAVQSNAWKESLAWFGELSKALKSTPQK